MSGIHGNSIVTPNFAHSTDGLLLLCLTKLINHTVGSLNIATRFKWLHKYFYTPHCAPGIASPIKFMAKPSMFGLEFQNCVQTLVMYSDHKYVYILCKAIVLSILCTVIFRICMSHKFSSL